MQQINDQVWTFTQNLRTLGIQMNTRMTAIRLADNKLVLHSPNKYSQQLANQLNSLGDISHIFSPSNMHNLYLDDWIRHCPNAAVYAPFEQEGAQPLEDHMLAKILAPFDKQLDIVYLQGLKNIREFIFFHEASRTLIVTDCIFNFHNANDFLSRILLRLNGAYRTTGPSRLYRSCIQQRELFSKSVRQILRWDFDQIILAHGDLINNRGKELFRQAFEAYL